VADVHVTHVKTFSYIDTLRDQEPTISFRYSKLTSVFITLVAIPINMWDKSYRFSVHMLSTLRHFSLIW